jgi:hypothetical protein
MTADRKGRQSSPNAGATGPRLARTKRLECVRFAAALLSEDTEGPRQTSDVSYASRADVASCSTT